jgi:hypothetical protein
VTATLGKNVCFWVEAIIYGKSIRPICPTAIKHHTSAPQRRHHRENPRPHKTLETVRPYIVFYSAMDATAAPTPDFHAMLTELANLGMRAARVVTRMMEIEQAAAEIAASALPEIGHTPASLAEAVAAGQDVDIVVAAMADAVPRVEVLALALDRVSRSVRRSVALMQRMQAGWPRAADDRSAMVRRQVARRVGELIRRGADGEAAERPFDELAERMDEPALESDILALPVDEIVRRISRDLGLATGTLADGDRGLPPRRNQARNQTPPDTG